MEDKSMWMDKRWQLPVQSRRRNYRNIWTSLDFYNAYEPIGLAATWAENQYEYK